MLLNVLQRLASLAKQKLLTPQAFNEAVKEMGEHYTADRLRRDILVEARKQLTPGTHDAAKEILRSVGQGGLANLATSAAKLVGENVAEGILTRIATKVAPRFLTALPVSGAVVGGIAAAVVLGGLYYGYQYSMGDKPVEYGSAAKNWVPPPELPKAEKARPKAKYVVVRVDNGHPIYSVRTEDQLRQTIPMMNFRHGGLSGEAAKAVPVGEPHATAADASRALADLLDKGSVRPAPLAAGTVANVGGKRVTIDDLGYVDFKIVRQVTAKQ